MAFLAPEMRARNGCVVLHTFAKRKATLVSRNYDDISNRLRQHGNPGLLYREGPLTKTDFFNLNPDDLDKVGVLNPTLAIDSMLRS